MPKNFIIPENFNGCFGGEIRISKKDYERFGGVSRLVDITPKFIRQTNEHLGLLERSDEELQIAVNGILKK